MARNFSGTDVGLWGATGILFATAAVSVTWWQKLTGSTAQAGRVFENTQDLVLWDPARGTLQFNRDYVTTDGVWTVARTALGLANASDLNVWRFFALTHTDGSAPQMSADGGALVTMTQTTAPVGAVNTAANRTLAVGNAAAGTRPLEGAIHDLAVHPSALSLQEIIGVMLHGPRTPRWRYPLLGDSTEPNLSGSSKALTLTGTTVVPGPPVMPGMLVANPFGPHAQPAAPAPTAARRHRRALTGVGR